MTGPAAGRVEVRGLGVSFGGGSNRGGRASAEVEALAGFELTVEPGCFVAVVGPSGSGKSTVLRVLAGVLRPSAGTATIDGHDVVGRPGQAAFMPQKDLLLPWRRALDNAVLGAELDGTPKAAARSSALALFERFGLAGFEQAWPSELSGGMRQRLALLRTFLFRRDLLLLDEPFGALDAITRQDMVTWLGSVWAADRRSALFVTHDVEEALLLADRVDVVSARPGRVVHSIEVPYARPRPPELITDPAFVAQRAEILAVLGKTRPRWT